MGDKNGDECEWIPDCFDFVDGYGLPLLSNGEVDGGAEGKLLDSGSLVSVFCTIYLQYSYFLSNDKWRGRTKPCDRFSDGRCVGRFSFFCVGVEFLEY